jgi:hypothetical protein
MATGFFLDIDDRAAMNAAAVRLKERGYQHAANKLWAFSAHGSSFAAKAAFEALRALPQQAIEGLPITQRPGGALDKPTRREARHSFERRV